MARQYRVAKNKIRARVRGRLTVPKMDGAIRTAQLENSATLRNDVRARAEALIKGRNRKLGIEDRNRGQSMVSLYTTRVLQNNTLSFYNRSPRALWFEEGVDPHWIFPRRGQFLKFPNVDPHGIGAATPDFGAWVYARAVFHPGQQGQHVMRDSLRDNLDGFERNIIGHVDRAISRGR